MKKVVGATLFVIYSIIAIIVTVLLLSYNEYNISEIGDYTVYIVNNDALEPEYEQGSILLIKGTNDKHVNVGDEIFLYKVISSQEYEIVNSTLIQKTQQGRHIIYTLDNGESYDNEYFIGKAEETSVITGPWGTLLSILESKWGYLFCIVIVSLLLFLQEVFNLVIELKYGNVKVAKKGNKAETKKTTTGNKTGVPVKKKVTTEIKPATTVASTSNVAKENNNPQTGEKEEG